MAARSLWYRQALWDQVSPLQRPSSRNGSKPLAVSESLALCPVLRLIIKPGHSHWVAFGASLAAGDWQSLSAASAPHQSLTTVSDHGSHHSESLLDILRAGVGEGGGWKAGWAACCA